MIKVIDEADFLKSLEEKLAPTNAADSKGDSALTCGSADGSVETA
jgi:hypothetical protein